MKPKNSLEYFIPFEIWPAPDFAKVRPLLEGCGGNYHAHYPPAAGPTGISFDNASDAILFKFIWQVPVKNNV